MHHLHYSMRRMPRASKSKSKPKKKTGNHNGKLNERQRKFVEHFMISGNASDASRKAGYKTKANVSGSTLLAKANIQAAIEKRQENDPTIMDRVQRQQFWTQVACDPKVAIHDRLKASELLVKSGADFIERRYNENVTVTDHESLNRLIGRHVDRGETQQVDKLTH